MEDDAVATPEEGKDELKIRRISFQLYLMLLFIFQLFFSAGFATFSKVHKRFGNCFTLDALPYATIH